MMMRHLIKLGKSTDRCWTWEWHSWGAVSALKRGWRRRRRSLSSRWSISKSRSSSIRRSRFDTSIMKMESAITKRESLRWVVAMRRKSFKRKRVCFINVPILNLSLINSRKSKLLKTRYHLISGEQATQTCNFSSKPRKKSSKTPRPSAR